MDGGLFNRIPFSRSYIELQALLLQHFRGEGL